MKMANIPGQSKIEAAVGERGYTAFSSVSSLAFFEERDGVRPTYSMTIVLESGQPHAKYRLRMRFTGVKGLVLRRFGDYPTQLLGFGVVDVSERQLEGVRFEVVDYEEDMIRFFCKTAEVEDVERICC